MCWQRVGSLSADIAIATSTAPSIRTILLVPGTTVALELVLVLLLVTVSYGDGGAFGW